jgi:site-specific DNA recombinase
MDEAVQTKLAASATARQLRLKGSPAILAGRIFDDRGNRMTPTHTNKRGARYRYDVSHALLQKRNDEAGSVPRVPAPEIESAVLKALHEHFGADENLERPTFVNDRDRIERRVDRIVVRAQGLEIHVADSSEHPGGINTRGSSNSNAGDVPPSIITVPWSAATFAEVKGVLHSPSPRPIVSSATREALLGAIAKARIWIDDLIEGRISSFAEIAEREGKVARHIRLLAPLAFVSPANRLRDHRWRCSIRSHRNQPCQAIGIFPDRASSREGYCRNLILENLLRGSLAIGPARGAWRRGLVPLGSAP